jgi:hypothetical protein
MLGIGLRKIGPFDYETIFAHVASIFTSRVGLTLSPWSVTIQQNNLRQDVQFGGPQPGGLADSCRWLKRSENHRNQSEKSCTTKWCENMKQAFIWHPVGVRSFFLFQPVVFASLRPPATFSQTLRVCFVAIQT